MTNENTSRRCFLEKTALSGCCLFASLTAGRAVAAETGRTKAVDFEKLTYCCFECDPDRCPLLKASLANDLTVKKDFAAKWRERYGREFAPEEVFCFGCKVEPARQGAAVKACDVRACVLEKKLASCAHCRELAGCQRALWQNYPQFREAVLELQKQVLG